LPALFSQSSFLVTVCISPSNFRRDKAFFEDLPLSLEPLNTPSKLIDTFQVIGTDIEIALGNPNEVSRNPAESKNRYTLPFSTDEELTSIKSLEQKLVGLPYRGGGLGEMFHITAD